MTMENWAWGWEYVTQQVAMAILWCFLLLVIRTEIVAFKAKGEPKNRREDKKIPASPKRPDSARNTGDLREVRDGERPRTATRPFRPQGLQILYTRSASAWNTRSRLAHPLDTPR